MAVERRAKLVIELQDLASRGIKSLVDVWAAFKIAGEAVNQTLGRLKAIIVDSLDSYAESERAVSRLNNALQNQGFYSKEYSAALVAQAAALQDVTTYSDEAVIETQTLLTTFGLAGDKLRDTTKASLDLASGLSIDLRSATLIMGKAWAGETATLTKYGFKIDETKTSAENFASVLSQVNGRFGGRAAADAETYAGKLTQLKNRFDDLKEKIGAELLPVANFWLEWVSKSIKKMDEAVLGHEKLTNANDKVLVSIRTRIEAVKGEIGMANRSLEEQQKLRAELDRLVKSYVDLTTAKKMAGESSDSPKAPESKRPEDTDLTAKLKERMDHLATTHIQVEDAEAQHLARIALLTDNHQEARRILEEQKETERLAKHLDAEGRFHEARNLLEAQSQRNAEEMSKKRMAVMLASLNQIASLSNAKTKELAIIGKAAAVSSAVINAHRGAALALGTIPPPYGFIMAGLVEAAGLVQAAQIAGVPLAEGGIGQARFGGIPAVIAENRKDEAIIPLDDERTAEKLRASGLGGGDGTHHHWHVGTLIADDASLMELSRRVDEKLFALGRRGGRVSG